MARRSNHGQPQRRIAQCAAAAGLACFLTGGALAGPPRQPEHHQPVASGIRTGSRTKATARAGKQLADGGKVMLLAQLFPGEIRHRAAADPAQESSPMPTLESYWKALDQIQSSFYNPDVDTQAESTGLTYSAIRGVLSSLNDPYTRFLAPDQFSEMQRENRGTFPGIGVELRTEGSLAYVDRVIPESPAANAGVQKDDQVVKVGDTEIKGQTTDAVGNLLRGEEGSMVALTLRRNGQELHFNLTRREVSYPHFESRLIGRDVGYMHLLMFDEQAAENIERALQSFSQGGVKGVILDLRDNPGGLLNAAIDVASKFIPGGPVVFVQERGGQRSPLMTNSDTTHRRRLPLVVLVNHYSASASEIVAGAIRDTHSGTLVGVRTWGKGLVQEVIPLNDDSAIALTTEHYYTPSGSDINLKGIVPEVAAGHILNEPDDPAAEGAYQAEKNRVDQEQLEKALTVLRARTGSVALRHLPSKRRKHGQG